MIETKNTKKTAKTAMPADEKPTFEQAAAELESIVEKLNSGSVMLDEMIVLYERGVALSDYCSAMLKEYDGRIEKAVRRTEAEE